MIKCFSVVYFIVCIGFVGIAQTPANSTTSDGSSYDLATNSTLGLHNFNSSVDISYDDIDGSPYFFEEFVLGKVLLANGLYDDSLLLKYDLAANAFLSKLDDGSQFSINSKSVFEYRFYVDDETIVFKRVDPRYPKAFYEILYESSNLTIYKSEDVKVVKGQELGISKSNDRFFKEVKYYIKQSSEISRVKLKKKNLWKFFSVKEQELLDQHIKDHDIKLKTDKDYRELFSLL